MVGPRRFGPLYVIDERDAAADVAIFGRPRLFALSPSRNGGGSRAVSRAAVAGTILLLELSAVAEIELAAPPSQQQQQQQCHW
mmetsp:Transcript_16245/g.35639  ORF Transcript_16245/g.35639 Transcript_16245/m.35639 type:complete len:83 (-) Transcript_16245:97-345(-)